jgi:putative phage-type endonuclease
MQKTIIKDIDQSTDEWLALRAGFITASRFKDVMAKGQGKTRTAYMYEIAAEIITGKPVEQYSNEHMQWGSETEAQAISMYEFENAVEGERIAFAHFDEKKIGCSPDLLVGNDGLAEFKCPKTATHIHTYLSGKMPSSHNAQVQGQMWVMGREWCDFVSFDPRINTEASYFSCRVYRDEEYIKNLSQECDRFLCDLDEMLQKLGHKTNNEVF